MKDLAHMLDIEQSVHPQSSAAATVNGDSVQRQGAHQAMLICGTGTATGSPTAQSITFKVQEEIDATWTDITGASVEITADDDEAAVRVPSTYNREANLRVVATVSFTGGSSPAQLIYGAIVLAELPQEPTSI